MPNLLSPVHVPVPVPVPALLSSVHVPVPNLPSHPCPCPRCGQMSGVEGTPCTTASRVCQAPGTGTGTGTGTRT
ncbi:MAG: hypothetical protein JNM74_03030 [Myxococcales bacterium]|nr:hypothetical protein [Myxococcales bacterium]